MATLTFEQIYALARNAGFTPDQAVIMTALTVPESGRDPGAQNPNDYGGRQSSFGLWQISTGTHTPPDPNWSDPFVNARLARQKYTTQGFGAWGAYNTGKYSPYLADARQAQARAEHNLRVTLQSIPHGRNAIQKGIDAAKGAVGNIKDAAVEPFAQLYETAARDVGNFGKTAAFVALGVGLVAMGAWRMMQPTIRRAQNRGAELAGAATKGAAL